MSRVANHPKQDKDAGLPAERIGGRYVTTYNPEIALEIIERLSQGQTLNEICAKGSSFPHQVTFKRWVVNHPELAKAYDAARQLSAVSLEEEALDLARQIKTNQRDGTQVRAYEVAISQLRWSASRRDPAKFGDRAPVSIRVPIQIHTTLDMGTDSKSAEIDKTIYTLETRTNVAPEQAIIDAESVEVTEPLVKPHEKALPIKPLRLTTSQPSSQSRAFLYPEEENRVESGTEAEVISEKAGNDPI